MQTVTGAIGKLKRLLRAVETGDENFGKWAKHGSVQRITERISPPEKKGVKICAPETVLNNIVKNFNESCEPAKFKEFFPAAYCKSCKLNIPPEVLFSMMSVESAGQCKARRENEREASVGLFQVNAEQHSCGNNARNTQANIKCLEDPARNLKYGLEILKGYYDEVSSDTAKTSDSCPNWRQLTLPKKGIAGGALFQLITVVLAGLTGPFSLLKVI